MSQRRSAERLLGLLLAAATSLTCQGGGKAREEEFLIGLLLSFSGSIAANSANSERAFAMAIEAANMAGGLNGRIVTVLRRDTGSDPDEVEEPARELADRTALVVGPDVQDLAIALRGVFGQRTLVLPSFATSFVHHKPTSWFVMGAGPPLIADQMFALAQIDGRQRPVALIAPNGYDTQIGARLASGHAVPQVLLPRSGSSSEERVRAIVQRGADSYFLSAPPPTASSLIYSLAALGELGEGSRWYLSPTLHTPVFLENIPRGILDGAHVVSVGGPRDLEAFAMSFRQRWSDEPLDDAYSFYDSAAIVVLALQRALRLENAIPTGTGLDRHLVAVTSAKGAPIRWNEIGRGLELLRAGQEVSYAGLTGPLQFDETGKSLVADTRMWVIRDHAFQEVHPGDGGAVAPAGDGGADAPAGDGGADAAPAGDGGADTPAGDGGAGS
jgi:ABC-type branched-subunit amino acid transport system substrate-binding protein